MGRSRHLTVLVLVVAAAVPATAMAANTGVPANGELAFTVLRDGDEVGTHRIRFEDATQGVTVQVKTRVEVKLPFLGIPVYHFVHDAQEVWRHGELVALRSTTDDDGETKRLSLNRGEDALEVDGSAGRHTSPPDLLPASLWHPDLVKRRVLLNTLDGSQMRVTVSAQGTEAVHVHGHEVPARHFVLSGELERELWYDPRGVLVKVAFSARDDSRIEYVLR